MGRLRAWTDTAARTRPRDQRVGLVAEPGGFPTGTRQRLRGAGGRHPAAASSEDADHIERTPRAPARARLSLLPSGPGEVHRMTPHEGSGSTRRGIASGAPTTRPFRSETMTPGTRSSFPPAPDPSAAGRSPRCRPTTTARIAGAAFLGERLRRRAGGACSCWPPWRGSTCGGWEIRTPEGLPPTRFPSERHRPLGESSSAPAMLPGAPRDPRHGRDASHRHGMLPGRTATRVRHPAPQVVGLPAAGERLRRAGDRGGGRT